MSQKHKIEELLNRCKMDNSNGRRIPFSAGLKLCSKNVSDISFNEILY